MNFSLKNWIPPAFSNIFEDLSAATTMRVTREGNGFFYMLQGTRQDFPFKTLFETFRRIPHLRAVIEKKASMFSNVNFKIVHTDNEDEVDYKHPLNDLLSNPNAFQSWRQMLFMVSLYKSIAGVAYMYPGFGINRTSKNLAFLKNIDFTDYQVEINHGVNGVTASSIDELIRWVQFYFDNQVPIKFDKPSELFILKDTYSSYTRDISRITTLKEPIENIYRALIARGILIEKKGGVGIISGNQKDGGVSVPMLPAEKQRLDDRLNKYGLDRYKDPIIITDVPLKYQPMVFPTNTLMLFEEIQDDFEQICDVYGIHREIFSGNTTFTNKEEANQATYADTIIPEWSDFFDVLNKGMNLQKEKRRLEMDYCHIAGLQESEKEKIDTEAAKSTMHLNELKAGAIDLATYQQLMGYEVTAAVGDMAINQDNTTGQNQNQNSQNTNNTDQQNQQNQDNNSGNEDTTY